MPHFSQVVNRIRQSAYWVAALGVCACMRTFFAGAKSPDALHCNVAGTGSKAEPAFNSGRSCAITQEQGHRVQQLQGIACVTGVFSAPSHYCFDPW